jgi:hypothetical protein
LRRGSEDDLLRREGAVKIATSRSILRFYTRRRVLRVSGDFRRNTATVFQGDNAT